MQLKEARQENSELKSTAKKLWEKNIDVNPEIERFTVGKDRELDLFLAPYDVIGSLAHSAMLATIGMLTEEEQGVVRRARNAKQSAPKSATPGEYHRATAFEALLGYLYLTGRMERLEEILTTANPDKEDAHA